MHQKEEKDKNLQEKNEVYIVLEARDKRRMNKEGKRKMECS